MDISRKLLVVLIVTVFAGGAGTAYAGVVLPTITLAGNVNVIGQLNCPNCIIGFYEESFFAAGTGGDLFFTLDCDEGDEVISGGYTVSSIDNANPPERSFKFDANTWKIDWDTSNISTGYTAVAYCADYAPPHIVI
jgi:hypothetical protein